MTSLDPKKYSGVWYEFARTSNLKWEEECLTAKATYKWDETAQKLYITNSCYNGKGDLIYSRSGEATTTEDSYVFDILFNDGLPKDPKSNYVVEETNYKDYAIVSSYRENQINHLWVLTRVAVPGKNLITNAMEKVQMYGINPESLRINYVC